MQRQLKYGLTLLSLLSTLLLGYELLINTPIKGKQQTPIVRDIRTYEPDLSYEELDAGTKSKHPTTPTTIENIIERHLVESLTAEPKQEEREPILYTVPHLNLTEHITDRIDEHGTLRSRTIQRNDPKGTFEQQTERYDENGNFIYGLITSFDQGLITGETEEWFNENSQRTTRTTYKAGIPTLIERERVFTSEGIEERETIHYCASEPSYWQEINYYPEFDATQTITVIIEPECEN